MDENKSSTAPGFDRDDAPDLSRDGWPEQFAKTTVRRGRPPVARPKVATTIRLSAGGDGLLQGRRSGLADTD